MVGMPDNLHRPQMRVEVGTTCVAWVEPLAHSVRYTFGYELLDKRPSATPEQKHESITDRRRRDWDPSIAKISNIFPTDVSNPRIGKFHSPIWEVAVIPF